MNDARAGRGAAPLSILIVDDSAMMRLMIRRALALAAPHAEISEAANGQDALAVLEARTVDAVFTDINMPLMTGPQLLREIDRRGWRHLRRVVISTDGSEARREEVRELDVLAYINKPFAPEDLLEVLARLQPDVHDAH